MLTKSNDLLGISLTEETLKIVHLKGSGLSAKISEVIVQDVKAIPEDEVSKLIQKSVQGVVSKATTVLYVLPSSMISTKNIEIPSTSPEEIKSIVNLQAGRHTPYSREEIQVGYINIGVYKTSYSKVLLVIANRLAIKNQIDIVERGGLKVKKVLFGPEGIATFYSEALNLKSDPAPIGIIDIGKQSTDFVITKSGLVIASRNIPVGRSHLNDAASKDKLLDELSKTIESYQSEDIEVLPARYILTANDPVCVDLQASLQSKLKWSVEIVPYIDHIKTASGALNRLATEQNDQSPLDVIACAAGLESAQINFMPEEVQLQKSIEDQGREVYKTAVLAFIILVVIAGIFILRIYFRNTFLTKLTNDFKDNRAEVLALENRSTKIKIIQNFMKNRMVSLDIINELYRNLPNEVYFTAISMDEEGNISVQGISDVGSLVYNLNSTLKESKLFKSADVKSKTAKKDRGKDVHAFEIVLRLYSAVDKPEKDSAVTKAEVPKKEGKL